MVIIIKAIYIVFNVLLTNVICHEDAYNYNVGTVLFSRTHLNRSRWKLGDVKLLRARRFFQTVLPPALNMTILDEDFVNTFYTLFETANNTIESDGLDYETSRIVTAALSDAFGGYLKNLILPAVKYSYYSGTISSENVTSMYNIYNRLKKNLNTDGSGWHKSRFTLNSNALSSTALETSPGLTPRNVKNPCGDLAFLEKTEEGLNVPIPRVNWQDEISTLLVPLRLPTMFSMDSPNGSKALVEYYENANDCLKMRSPTMLKNFQNRFQCWLHSDILPHLSDDRLYLALGSILTLVKDAQAKDVNVNSTQGKYMSLMKGFHVPAQLTSKKMIFIILLVFIEVLFCISALCGLRLSRRKKGNASNVCAGVNDRNSDSEGCCLSECDRQTSYMFGNFRSSSTASFEDRSDVKILYQRKRGDVNNKPTHTSRMSFESETKCSTPQYSSKEYKRVTKHHRETKHNIEKMGTQIESKGKPQKSSTPKHYQIRKTNATDDTYENTLKHKNYSNMIKPVFGSSEKFSEENCSLTLANNNSSKNFNPATINTIYHRKAIAEINSESSAILTSTDPVPILFPLPNAEPNSNIMDDKGKNNVSNSECKIMRFAPVMSNSLKPTLVDTSSRNTNPLLKAVNRKNEKHVRISDSMTKVICKTASSSFQSSMNTGPLNTCNNENMYSNECSKELCQQLFKSVGLIEAADIKCQKLPITNSSSINITKSASKTKRKRNTKRFGQSTMDKDETSSTNTDIIKKDPTTDISDISELNLRKPRKRTVRQSVRPLKTREDTSNVIHATRKTEKHKSFNALHDEYYRDIINEYRGKSTEIAQLIDIDTKVNESQRKSEDNISKQKEIESFFDDGDKTQLVNLDSDKVCQNIVDVTEASLVEVPLGPDTIDPVPLQPYVETSVALENVSGTLELCKTYSKVLLYGKNKSFQDNAENRPKRCLLWEITVNRPERDVVDIKGNIKIRQYNSKIPKRTVQAGDCPKTILQQPNPCKGKSFIPLRKTVADDISLCTKDSAVPNMLNTTI